MPRPPMAEFRRRFVRVPARVQHGTGGAVGTRWSGRGYRHWCNTGPESGRGYRRWCNTGPQTRLSDAVFIFLLCGSLAPGGPRLRELIEPVLQKSDTSESPSNLSIVGSSDSNDAIISLMAALRRSEFPDCKSTAAMPLSMKALMPGPSQKRSAIPQSASRQQSAVICIPRRNP